MEKIFEEELLKEISQKFNLQKRQKINYEKFITIYKNYSKYFSELEFANLLGINDRSYRKIARDHGTEAFVFMNQNLTEEEKKENFMKLANKYQLYKGQEIRLSFFKEMYETLKIKLTDMEFAELLGIKKKTYIASKEKQNGKVRILMNSNLSDNEKKQKLLELVQQYNLYKGQKIDYKFFREMYQQVKIVLTEIEFANLLGISAGNLKNIRNTKDKARLFKNMELKKETIEKIRKSIIMKYEGKPIYYIRNIENKGKVDFLELYKPYRIYFTENEFAEILGISEKNIWYTKNNQANPIIKDIEKVKKVEELKKEIVEGRYYDEDEIEKICQNANLSVDDFITYYINKGKFFDPSEYRKALKNNGRLWLGKTRIERSNIEKYIEIYNRIVRTVINSINQKYREYYLEEDIKEEMLIYIFENCGDIVLNFQYDEKLMERMLWLRTRQYGQIKYITELKKDINKI